MITLLLIYSKLHKLWQCLLGQHLHALRIIYNESKFEHTSELFKSTEILNAYKLNIFNTAVSMNKIQGKSAPSIFLPKFRKPSHLYPVRFSHLNYVKPTPKLNKCKYGISYREPFIWNDFLSPADKEIIDVAKFKAATNSKLLSLQNETSFSNIRYLYFYTHIFCTPTKINVESIGCGI